MEHGCRLYEFFITEAVCACPLSYSGFQDVSYPLHVYGTVNRCPKVCPAGSHARESEIGVSPGAVNDGGLYCGGIGFIGREGLCSCRSEGDVNICCTRFNVILDVSTVHQIIKIQEF